eukprot:GHUV01001554.1.p1 GENE.GHUV01001554.1~~GHUV01001554.1.p1  ORF type:complete len:531 (+),score=65.54 GHUV01001554.1:510-2102(+)
MASFWPREDAYVWGPLLSAIVVFIANVLAYALNPNSWAHRKILSRCGIPRMFFVSNRADNVDKRALPKTYWAFDLLEPAHVVQSHILSTPLLLLLHLFTFLYFVATVLVDVVVGYYHEEGNRGPYGGWVTFLTNWSITLLGLAGLVAFIDTARHIKRERYARKCLKAAQQPTVQRSSSSQMGNLEGTDAITSWRDYQHASRTNSLTGGLSPNGTRRISNPSSPRNNSDYTTGQGSSSVPGSSSPPDPVAMLNPNPGQPNPNVANYPSPGVVNPAVIPATGLNPAVQSPVYPNGGTILLKPKRGSVPAATAAAPAGPDVAHAGDRKVDSSGLAVGTPFHHGAADTVIQVQDGLYSRKPTIKGIDQWDILSAAHCIIMEIGTTAAFFVSFWYWVGIVGITNSGFALSAGTYMAHAGNVAVALLQILLTRQPIVSVHFQVLLWYATLYEIFLWIYGEVSGIWRYNLDWQVSKPAGAFALIPVITFIMFSLWYLAGVLRERAFVPVTEKVAERHRQNHAHNGNRGHQRREIAMT